MSREYFTRTSLYLVRLKMFEWINFLRRHLHQFHNCLAWEFTAHYTCKKAEMNLKSTSTSGFNFRITNSLMEFRGGGGYAWPGLTAIIISLSNVGGFVFTRRVLSSAKLIVRSACAEFISSKDSTVETVLGTHRATSLADNYSKSKSPPNQSNNMDQSDWRSSQLRLLKK